MERTWNVLRQSTGELSTGVGIKPSNILAQDGPVEHQPDLVHLTLSSHLEQGYLQVASDEHTHSKPNKDEGQSVDLISELITQKTAETSVIKCRQRF